VEIMKFTNDQLLEIEDRGNNLLQLPLLTLRMLADNEAVEMDTLERSFRELERLREWVRDLRPRDQQYRRNRR